MSPSMNYLSIEMYKLEKTSVSHSSHLSRILQSYNVGSTPDICLITREGHTVYTNKVLLVINSKMMTEVMVDNHREEMIRISVPISYNILVNLISILSHGVINSDVKFDPSNVLGAADILGISFMDLQIEKDIKNPVFESIDEISHIDNKNVGIISANKIEEAEEISSNPHDNVDDKELSTSMEMKENLEKNEACEVCENTFRTVQHRNRHMLTHTGEKPFKCEKCDKYFSQKVNLERHTILHTGLKPYKCDSCEKEFNRKEYLGRHMKIHTKY